MSTEWQPIKREQAAAWLVEWRFNGVQWLYLWPSSPGGFSFTSDPDQALRFSRREDAETALHWAQTMDSKRGHRLQGDLLATEHVWYGTASVALSPPEQAAEPVGWFKFDRVSQCYHPQYDEYASTHAAKEGWVKLYASPPKREPLAPEQIDDSIIGQCKQRGTTDDGAVIISAQDLYDFARAVERAHGIGETP